MKEYIKPMMDMELFAANEYFSACGDSGTTYKFTCDAGGGVYGSVYLETNNTPGLQTGRGGDQQIASYDNLGLLGESGYHACKETHVAESNDPFHDGYYCPQGKTENPIQVIVWKGPNNDNVHCTTNLDISSWETAKS